MKTDTTIPTQWVLERLMTLSKLVKDLGSSDDDAECILPQIISSIARLHRTILDPSSGATTGGQVQLTSISRAVSIFRLSIPARVNAAICEFKLTGSHLEVPVFLRTALTKFNCSDDYSDMSARLGVDFLLMEARQFLIGSDIPRADDTPSARFQIVPDVDLSVKVCDPTTWQDIVVSGRADWVAGYATGEDIAVSFVALQAKTPALFSGLYVQLLTTLAIARECLIRQRVKDVVVQGFVTDGVLYRFVKIDAAGDVRESRIYEVFLDGQMEVVFSFVCEMLCAAAVGFPWVPAVTEEPDCETQQQEQEEDEDGDHETNEGEF